MKSPEKTLILGGFQLLLAGLLFGAVYGYLVQHKTLLVLRESYRDVLVSAASRDQPAAARALQRARKMNYDLVRAVDVHTHLIKMASVVILAGIVYPFVALGERRRRALAVLFLAAAWLFPLGVLAEVFSRSVVPQAVAAAGAALAVLSLGGIMFGLFRGLRAARSKP